MDDFQRTGPEGARGGTPLHGGRREAASRLYGIPREEFLDFSASINPLGPPQGVTAAVRAAAVEMAHYPEEVPADLTAAAAAFLGVDEDQVVMGNGSSELIYWMAVELAPRRVLVVEPTFSEYRMACEAAGARCESMLLEEEESFALDVEKVRPEGYDLVFVCNPNNPTGYFTPPEEMMRLRRRCRGAGAALAVDEAFIDFTAYGQSILEDGLEPGLFVIRSFTKSHALAGLRLGALACESDHANRLRRRMPPWNINAFARAAGMAALADGKYLKWTRRELEQARSSLFMGLMALPGIEPLPSAANFLLCRLENGGASRLAAAMARQGILVRDCNGFTGLGDRYIRVAVRSEDENHQLLSVMGIAMKRLAAERKL